LTFLIDICGLTKATETAAIGQKFS